jgi:hypothetical protein
MLFSLMLAAAIATPSPAPDRARAIVAGEAAIAEHLIDPYSAHFKWPYEFAKVHPKKPSRWTTCGEVNAKNSFGGYTGGSRFFVSFEGDRLVDAQISSADAELGGWVGMYCDRLIKRGLMQSVSVSQ